MKKILNWLQKYIDSVNKPENNLKELQSTETSNAENSPPIDNSNKLTNISIGPIIYQHNNSNNNSNNNSVLVVTLGIMFTVACISVCVIAYFHFK